jgi:ABC-type branched-subunit amino acid transport system permease subunit
VVLRVKIGKGLMQISNDKKADILLNLLKERYDASHKMRERSLNFAIWIMGFGIALIWILLNGSPISQLQKIVLTCLVLVGGVLTRRFLKSIQAGFEENHKVMVKIEDTLGCYEKGAYIGDEPLFPEKYKDLSNKETSHFGSIYIWLIAMGLALILMIWLSPCK